MSTAEPSAQIASARPEMTAAIMAETGLDEEILRDLVHSFYDKVRRDAVLGPIFAARITDWGPHLERMVAFWSSVALMTGRYHGRPVPAHTPLPIDGAHFQRWLGLFPPKRPTRSAHRQVPCMSLSEPNASPARSTSQSRRRRPLTPFLPFADERKDA